MLFSHRHVVAVIPAKAGIHCRDGERFWLLLRRAGMDSSLRWNDGDEARAVFPHRHVVAVIPAKAGIHCRDGESFWLLLHRAGMDSSLRWNDDGMFLRRRRNSVIRLSSIADSAWVKEARTILPGVHIGPHGQER